MGPTRGTIKKVAVIALVLFIIGDIGLKLRYADWLGGQLCFEQRSSAAA